MQVVFYLLQSITYFLLGMVMALGILSSYQSVRW